MIVMWTSCTHNSVKSGIENQLKEFPESRVQDIYKSFCQDNLGPEHLIPNPDAARNYLTSELEEYRQDLAAIDELVKADNLIIHHSDTFGDTYHPHYRIIAKDIFEKEILPRL